MDAVESASGASRAPRRLRGVVLAVAATLLGAVAHAVGGGATPHPVVLVPLAALTAVVGVGLSGSGLRPLRVIGVLAGSQLAMHLLFTLSHPHPHVGELSSTTVIAGHVVAVIVISLLLAHADALLCRVGDFLAAVLPTWWPTSAPDAELLPHLPARAAESVRWNAVQLVLACPRRGPPISR